MGSSELIRTDQKKPQSKNQINELDMVCFSHLRWDFVYQRPQHLLSRFSPQQRVYYIEEPVIIRENSRLRLKETGNGVQVVVPEINADLTPEQHRIVIRALLKDLFETHHIKEYIIWYYTPIGIEYTQGLTPRLSVYDCMDELSAFKNAPQHLHDREKALFQEVDIVFTGGQSIYQSKRPLHPNVHLFPSSIDFEHFQQARCLQNDPQAQADIPHPRLGYFGVIDERMDLGLLAQVADARPDWHLVMIGPVVKIDVKDLPVRPNIHYLGMQPYSDLPAYLSGWDIAMIPFALNESTRFISPTKTPEYLAGGKPVVSTPIHDVVQPYGELGLASIAKGCQEFIRAVESAMYEQSVDGTNWLEKVDEFLSHSSWDRTWEDMVKIIEVALRNQ